MYCVQDGYFEKDRLPKGDPGKREFTYFMLGMGRFVYASSFRLILLKVRLGEMKRVGRRGGRRRRVLHGGVTSGSFERSGFGCVKQLVCCMYTFCSFHLMRCAK